MLCPEGWEGECQVVRFHFSSSARGACPAFLLHPQQRLPVRRRRGCEAGGCPRRAFPPLPATLALSQPVGPARVAGLPCPLAQLVLNTELHAPNSDSQYFWNSC